MFKSLGVSLSFITSGSLALFLEKKQHVESWTGASASPKHYSWIFHGCFISSFQSCFILQSGDSRRDSLFCFMVQEQLPVGRWIHHHWSKKNWRRYEGLWGTRCRWTPTCPWPNWSGTPKCDLNPGRIWKDSCGRLVSSRFFFCVFKIHPAILGSERENKKI